MPSIIRIKWQFRIPPTLSRYNVGINSVYGGKYVSIKQWVSLTLITSRYYRLFGQENPRTAVGQTVATHHVWQSSSAWNSDWVRTSSLHEDNNLSRADGKTMAVISNGSAVSSSSTHSARRKLLLQLPTSLAALFAAERFILVWRSTSNRIYQAVER